MRVSAPPKSHHGVIVPLVTPLTADCQLDELAVERLVEFLCDGGVHGVFVLGTTGEGPAVPADLGERLVRRVVRSACGRLRVYAGISGESSESSIAAGNRYLRAGVTAVVAHAPARYEKCPEQSLLYFAELARHLEGELIIYNMPLTTHVSLPLDVCTQVARKPRIIGIKDSENNPERLGALLRQVGDLESFSVFVGSGPLMADGLLRGASGIVPSVGNLVPRLCRQLYDSASAGDRAQTRRLNDRFLQVARVYQQGRTLGESLAALKGAMSALGLCGPHVFPPLQPVPAAERARLAAELARLGVATTGVA